MRALIVDDEELGRDLLRSRLRAVDAIEVLGESADGFGALKAIRDLRPDVVFMDIEIPGLDGLRVVEQIAASELPLVIFVTAHSTYATRAFELNALDYVLKPFTTLRLVEAVERARTRLLRSETGTTVRDGTDVTPLSRVDGAGRGREDAGVAADRIVQSSARDGEGVAHDFAAPGTGRPRRLIVRDRAGYALLQITDIESLEAAGNYVRIVSGPRVFVMRSTMADMEALLDADQFARVHRSTIVNIDAIQRITPHASGDFEIRLNSGRVLRMSRSYRTRLLP